MQVIRFRNQAVAPIFSHSTADYASKRIGERLIGVSRWTEATRTIVAAHAAHDNTVILEGERGTGKRLLASLIHRFSGRHEGPFVCLELGSTSDEVARAALFGLGQRQSDDVAGGEKGLTELAQRGTLYIAGLSDISRSLTDDCVALGFVRLWTNSLRMDG